MNTETCRAADCAKPAQSRGWCRAHHRAEIEKGNRILIRTPKPAAERFWPKVDKASANGCWNWTGAIGPNGYGYFGAPKGTSRLAHRFAYESVNGPVPNGLQLDHLCRNRRCVNPTHLEAVTQRVNTLRSDGPTALNSRATHCKKGHEFTPENTAVYRGKRECRTCKRTRLRAAYQSRKGN
ncbi:HNH endonuclease signature motif containing protein [Streptomyces nigra]|uniref:HNH endonuclease signature motif containing protein n=1 Tax=Streptomyces nigra TaxID=1827580 RepID=UPI0037D43141